MYMIQIEEGKMDKLSEHIEQSLKHMGKAMQCVDEWMDEGGMGHREGSSYSGGRYGGGNMGSRYPMYGGYGMGYKDDEDWEDDEMMGERRGRRRRDSRGRYM
jgi:hypothetical protein